MSPFVDWGERYYQISLLGRESFVSTVAPASLVMKKATRRGRIARGTSPPDADDTLDERLLANPAPSEPLPIVPLCKKLGTPFVDLITVGRAANNDICLSDASVSSFQAFFRPRAGLWYLCDASSTNGTKIDGQLLHRLARIIHLDGCLDLQNGEALRHEIDGCGEAHPPRRHGRERHGTDHAPVSHAEPSPAV